MNLRRPDVSTRRPSFGSGAAAARYANVRRTTIEPWLLRAPQLRDGPHAGGVAGTVGGDGDIGYVYPEITGYYLQWLAWQALRRGADTALCARAAAAQRWITRWIRAPGRPRTRVYLTEKQTDWRNEHLFCFDLAMVLRGVASASAAGLLDPHEETVLQLDALLGQLIGDDDRFAACVPMCSQPAARRWSTRRGAFLAKAAAGILRAAEALSGISARVRAAAEASYRDSLTAMVDSPHDDLHPLLYAVEGILGSDDISADAVARCIAVLDTVLERASATGRLLESSASAIERVDVTAQALRAAALLASIHPAWQPNRSVTAALADRVERSILMSGGLPFAVDAQAGANVWATMFADQALVFAFAAPGDVSRYRTLIV